MASCIRLPLNFLCACPPGTAGRHCERTVAACQHVSCLHGGKCQQVGLTFRCRCLDGYEGDFCQREVDLCSLPESCPAGGRCIDRLHGRTCLFAPAHTSRPLPVDESGATKRPVTVSVQFRLLDHVFRDDYADVNSAEFVELERRIGRQMDPLLAALFPDSFLYSTTSSVRRSRVVPSGVLVVLLGAFDREFRLGATSTRTAVRGLLERNGFRAGHFRLDERPVSGVGARSWGKLGAENDPRDGRRTSLPSPTSPLLKWVLGVLCGVLLTLTLTLACWCARVFCVAATDESPESPVSDKRRPPPGGHRLASLHPEYSWRAKFRPHDDEWPALYPYHVTLPGYHAYQ